jgi:hypothetical protein
LQSLNPEVWKQICQRPFWQAWLPQSCYGMQAWQRDRGGAFWWGGAFCWQKLACE